MGKAEGSTHASGASHWRRPTAALALACALAAFAFATLWPAPGPSAGVPPPDAAPGGIALSDVLRNLALLLPAGAAAVLLGVRPGLVAAAGLALGLAVEAAQLAIPGRDPSLVDVIANASGAGLGALAAAHADAWLRPRPLAAALALAVCLAALAGTGLLLAAAPGRAADGPLSGHWTPDLGHLAPYAGSLDAARLDGAPVPHGRLPDAEAVRASLTGPFRVEVEGRAGPAPSGQAALLLITDVEGHGLLLLGPEGPDLVLRYRSRGQALGLESTRVRSPGALAAAAPGDAIRVQARRSEADLCLAVNGLERCGLGPTVGDGWMLLLPERSAFDRLRPALAMAWLALWAFPVGLFAPSRGGAAWLAAGLAGAAALPLLGGLRPTPLAQLGAAAAALWGGRRLGLRLGRGAR